MASLVGAEGTIVGVGAIALVGAGLLVGIPLVIAWSWGTGSGGPPGTPPRRLLLPRLPGTPLRDLWERGGIGGAILRRA